MHLTFSVLIFFSLRLAAPAPSAGEDKAGPWTTEPRRRSFLTGLRDEPDPEPEPEPEPYVAPPPTRLQQLSRPYAKRQQDAVFTKSVINYHASVKPRPFFETHVSYDANMAVKYRAPCQQPALKSGANLPAYGVFRPLGSGVARTVVGFGGGRTARRAPHESVYKAAYSHKELYPCTLR